MSELGDKLKARAKELDSERYYHGEATLLAFAAEVLRESGRIYRYLAWDRDILDRKEVDSLADELEGK